MNCICLNSLTPIVGSLTKYVLKYSSCVLLPNKCPCFNKLRNKCRDKLWKGWTFGFIILQSCTRPLVLANSEGSESQVYSLPHRRVRVWTNFFTNYMKGELLFCGFQTSNGSKFGPNAETDSRKDELWVSNFLKLEKGKKRTNFQFLTLQNSKRYIKDGLWATLCVDNILGNFIYYFNFIISCSGQKVEQNFI